MMIYNKPTLLGPPIKAQPFSECLIMGADGVARAGSCPGPTNPPSIDTTTPTPVVITTQAPAQQPVNWTTLALIGIGIYLLTKG